MEQSALFTIDCLVDVNLKLESGSSSSSKLNDNDISSGEIDPVGTWQAYPLEQLYYCQQCNNLKSPPQTVETISNYFCPRCEMIIHNYEAQKSNFYCSKCLSCPLCIDTITLITNLTTGYVPNARVVHSALLQNSRSTSTEFTGEDDSTGEHKLILSAKGDYQYRCPNCLWVSGDVGIKSDTISGLLKLVPTFDSSCDTQIEYLALQRSLQTLTQPFSTSSRLQDFASMQNFMSRSSARLFAGKKNSLNAKLVLRQSTDERTDEIFKILNNKKTSFNDEESDATTASSSSESKFSKLNKPPAPFSVWDNRFFDTSFVDLQLRKSDQPVDLSQLPSVKCDVIPVSPSDIDSFSNEDKKAISSFSSSDKLTVKQLTMSSAASHDDKDKKRKLLPNKVTLYSNISISCQQPCNRILLKPEMSPHSEPRLNNTASALLPVLSIVRIWSPALKRDPSSFFLTPKLLADKKQSSKTGAQAAYDQAVQDRMQPLLVGSSPRLIVLQIDNFSESEMRIKIPVPSTSYQGSQLTKKFGTAKAMNCNELSIALKPLDELSLATNPLKSKTDTVTDLMSSPSVPNSVLDNAFTTASAQTIKDKISKSEMFELEANRHKSIIAIPFCATPNALPGDQARLILAMEIGLSKTSDPMETIFRINLSKFGTSLLQTPSESLMMGSQDSMTLKSPQ